MATKRLMPELVIVKEKPSVNLLQDDAVLVGLGL
jgi:hypothetical protein